MEGMQYQHYVLLPNDIKIVLCLFILLLILLDKPYDYFINIICPYMGMLVEMCAKTSVVSRADFGDRDIINSQPR